MIESVDRKRIARFTGETCDEQKMQTSREVKFIATKTLKTLGETYKSFTKKHKPKDRRNS